MSADPRRPLAVLVRLAALDELPLLIDIDDDACRLYEEHGVHLAPLEGSAFAVAERARWARCVVSGSVFVATSCDEGAAIGFAACRSIDGEPYLDQLSVRLTAMRCGVGATLIENACAWARARGGARLWLTTYDHVPFNRPMYERRGFAVVAESACGPELASDLEEQRRALPFPDERVAMCRLL